MAASKAVRKTLNAGQASLGLSITMPGPYQAPSAAPVGEPPLLDVPVGLPADVTANLATAPESRTAVMNGKMGELAQAREVLARQTQSVKLAQDAIAYWNTQLLSSNSTVRESAWQKMMAQLMQIKRLLPDMAIQEQTIARLEKDVAAERMLIDTWPAQAGLVGGSAYGAYPPTRFAGYAPRFINNPRHRFF